MLVGQERDFFFARDEIAVDEVGGCAFDFYGTWVSYIGYFLMALGFFLTLFNRNSRYILLSKSIRTIRQARKAAAIIIVLLGLSSLSFAQTTGTCK